MSGAIGIFDSGLGGLSVLRLLPAALPSEQFIYVADTARAPYGSKPAAEITQYSVEISDLLIEQHGCRALVIACNTATAAAAQVIRKRYPTTPIIAMEPALKPAAAHSQSGVIGVMATTGTIGSERYTELRNRYGKELSVIENPCLGLVQLIESGADDAALQPILTSILQPMLKAGVDTIVLGCTHFPLILPSLEKIAGPTVKFIDPAPAVTRELQRRMQAENTHWPAVPGASKEHLFLTSGDVGAFRQNVFRIVPQLAARAQFRSLAESLKPPPQPDASLPI